MEPFDDDVDDDGCGGGDGCGGVAMTKATMMLKMCAIDLILEVFEWKFYVFKLWL